MTVKEVIENLQAKGHSVSYRKRSDGGYLITKIDGVNYSGAKGNSEARKMVGAELSARREKQLLNIKPKKGASPQSRKTTQPPLSEKIRIKIQRVQRLWRKNVSPKQGYVSTARVRKNIELYGEEAAMASLEKAERYALGYAYEANVEYLIEAIRRLAIKFHTKGGNMLEELANQIEAIKSMFMEKWIEKCYEVCYDIDTEKKSVDTGVKEIKAICNLA